MVRARNPDLADDLLEAAARLLSKEGRKAVTARRLASEVGASTMAVYTHFGSMEELFVQLWRDGFTRFGAALEGPAVTADPVADWVTQGWAYRHFALDNGHLYRVMFSDALLARPGADAADDEAAGDTFEALLRRLQRCVDAGRLDIVDVRLAGEAVWMMVHGHVSIELTGFFSATGRDPEVVYAECILRLGLGLGDEPEALAASMRSAKRRTRRTG